MITLQKELQKEKQNNQDLRRQLTESNKNASSQYSEIRTLKDEIKNMRIKDYDNIKKITNLTNEIKLKGDEIQRLNSKIKNLGNKFRFPLNVIFRSMDGSVNLVIICYYNELFTMVEERLYQIFPKLRNPFNIFLFNGTKVDKKKSIIMNEIYDRAILLIVNPY